MRFATSSSADIADAASARLKDTKFSVVPVPPSIFNLAYCPEPADLLVAVPASNLPSDVMRSFSDPPPGNRLNEPVNSKAQ